MGKKTQLDKTLKTFKTERTFEIEQTLPGSDTSAVIRLNVEQTTMLLVEASDFIRGATKGLFESQKAEARRKG